MTSLTSRITGPRHATRLGPLDQRLVAWRPDIAELSLADRVAVTSYVIPVELVATAAAPMLGAAHADAPAVSEILPGEGFALLDSSHGFGWGYNLRDHYVGYVSLSVLAPRTAPATHRVGPSDALVFATADIKAPVIACLPAGSLVSAPLPADNGFFGAAGGHIHHRHLHPLSGPASDDWVALALGYAGAPYRWGGRQRSGIDCSGLVQMARLMAGHPCRRDSDMQCADTVEITADEAMRGDLVFWPGHVGILLSSDTVLHANAHWMRCVTEPLADISARAGTPPRIGRFPVA